MMMMMMWVVLVNVFTKLPDEDATLFSVFHSSQQKREKSVFKLHISSQSTSETIKHA